MKPFVQTELHRHLDVSIRPGTLLSLAQERGLEGQSTSEDAFRERFIMKQPMSDLGAVLAQFTLFQQVLDRPDVLERVAFEAAEDCYREGTRKIEFRFSPGFVCALSKLAWVDALDGFDAGLARARAKYPDLRTGLLCIGSRDLGMASIERTVEFFLKHQERFVGIDLAGDEALYPNENYTRIFQPIRDSGARITIHAGEASGPDSMWAALGLLGAQRIGHGIACVQDPKLMDYLRDHAICLEMCPTSNWLTSAVPDLRKHPLPLALRHGIPVCINTDDPGIFGAGIPDEVRIAKTVMGLSDAEIEQCFAHADRASFI